MRRFLMLAAVLIVAGTAGGLVPAAPASAQYFGKNKVQYKDFRWQVLETDHFDVYYYEGVEEAAFDAARMAERSYRRLAYLLRHEIRDRVPLILYASHTDFQSTNISPELISEGTGGVTEFLKRRVYLPFTGSYAELEHVLTHELVHAFQVDIFWGGDRRSLFANPFQFQPPLWVMEGSAEYLSLGGLDPNTEMWLRDGALQGYLTSLPVLNQVYDIRVYRYGQAVFEYIGRRYGPEKVGEILRRMAATRNVEGSFRAATGLTLEKLSEAWTEEVRRTYLPQVAEHEKPSAYGRRLTDMERDDSGYNVAPALSPEGDKVVFASNRDLTSSLYLASALDGKILGRIVEGERSGDLESLRFFYSSSDWSPDGTLLAFAAKAGGRDEINIYDVRSRERIRRIRFDELDGIRSPSWSPDGETLVFAGFMGGTSDLFLCDADGGNLRQLTDDRYAALEPRFRPDGAAILFTSDRGANTDYGELHFGPQQLTEYDLATGEIRVLPGQVGEALSPHYSPDGSQILFVGDRNGFRNLYRYDVTSGSSVQLTRILTGVSGITPGSPPLSVARSGKRLVFSVFDRGGWDLYAVKDPFVMAAVDTVRSTDVTASSPLAWRATGLAELTRVVVERDRSNRAEGGRGAEPGEALAPLADSLVTVVVRPGLDAGADLDPDEGEAPPAEPTDPAPPGATGEEGVPEEIGASGADAPGPAPGEDEEGEEPFVRLRGPRGGIGGMTPPPYPDSLLARIDELPDSASVRHVPFRSRFTPDYGAAAAAVGGGIGLAGQAYISLSDILGDKQILIGAGIYGSLTDADLIFQYVNLANRVNYGFAVFQFRNDFLLSTRSSDDEYQSNIYRGGELLLSRPFDMFHRVEFSLRGVAVTERIYRFQGWFQDSELEEDLGTRFYVAPALALVKDTALYGSTGPIMGTRARLELRQGLGGQSFTDVTADLRHYINIEQRYALATRVLGATSQGQDPQVFRIGGPFTNRAVDYGDQEGSNILLANLEFRVPFIDELRTAFPLPLHLGGIRGALFFDAGAAWGETYLIDRLEPEEQRRQRVFTPFSSGNGFRLDDVKAAYGFGVRMNLGFLLIRWDLARPTDLRSNTGPWKGYFALGGEF